MEGFKQDKIRFAFQKEPFSGFVNKELEESKWMWLTSVKAALVIRNRGCDLLGEVEGGERKTRGTF